MTSYHIPIMQVAEILGVSHWTVRRLVERGGIPSLRVGSRIVIPYGELAEWIRKHRSDYAGGAVQRAEPEGPDPWEAESNDPTPTPPPR